MNPAVQIQVTHRFAAPAQRVFEAWLHPTQAARFLFRTRTGNVMCCEVNPVVGGGFVVTDRRPVADGEESVFDAVHRGRYVSIDPPHELVFDLTVVHLEDEPSRVTVRVVPLGASACELTLTHDLGASDEAFLFEEATRKGWQAMLALMERELFPRRVSLTL